MSDNPKVITLPGTMYNLLFGMNPQSETLLQTVLGWTKHDIPRFRDVELEFDQTNNSVRLAVYTRMGGGNRECWNQYDDEEPDCSAMNCPACTMTNKVEKHKQFLMSEDDDFDNTYATYYFSVTAEQAAALKQAQETLHEQS